MTTTANADTATDEIEQYTWLHARPDNWRKQLWLTGRTMSVGMLVYSMRASEMLDDPEAAAANWALSLDQVLEALEYYRRHRDIIEADADEEKRWLIERGILRESDR